MNLWLSYAENNKLKIKILENFNKSGCKFEKLDNTHLLIQMNSALTAHKNTNKFEDVNNLINELQNTTCTEIEQFKKIFEIDNMNEIEHLLNDNIFNIDNMNLGIKERKIYIL